MNRARYAASVDEFEAKVTWPGGFVGGGFHTEGVVLFSLGSGETRRVSFKAPRMQGNELVEALFRSFMGGYSLEVIERDGAIFAVCIMSHRADPETLTFVDTRGRRVKRRPQPRDGMIVG